MSRVCDLTGTKPFYGNKVSHSNIKTRTRWLPNLQTKKYIIPELKRTVTLSLTSRAIRTIDKLGGITQAMFKQKEEKLSDSLLSIKRAVQKSRRQALKPAAKKAK